MTPGRQAEARIQSRRRRTSPRETSGDSYRSSPESSGDGGKGDGASAAGGRSAGGRGPLRGVVGRLSRQRSVRVSGSEPRRVTMSAAAARRELLQRAEEEVRCRAGCCLSESVHEPSGVRLMKPASVSDYAWGTLLSLYFSSFD